MKKTKHRLIAAIFAILMLTSLPVLLMFSSLGNSMPFTGLAAEYCEELMEDGFPQDYAVALTKLHLVHPNWSFVPLNVTETNSDYTWNYVIGKETASPTVNLVSKQEAYRDYWHATNRQVYDSGYYQPSADAVEYFMDPRNFLNEADIFQFYDLSNPSISSRNAVDAVLSGSFMENALLSNGKTYTEYLIEIGEEIGIDAVYLAVKLRQEQGANGTSPIISGTCGDTLLSFYLEQKQTTDSGSPINPPAPGEADEAELEALNGLYNPFNVGATGNGVFAIYQGAMKYAQKGSESMAERWGGSPSWDSDWKGIYGGALFIKEKYIDRYQSTIYLQKFDVDGRNPNGNFKNQYMQNIFGALSEGRSLYRSFASNDTLDTDCRFLIPIYASMPTECADPANGSCAAFAPASKGYETTAEITHPQRLRQYNDAVYGEITVTSDESLTITGTFTHSYGVNRLEYSFDGVEWVPCSDSGTLELTLSEDLPEHGEYLLLIRGEAAYDSNDGNKKLNRYFLCAAFHLTLLPPPTLTLTLQAGNVISDEKKYYEGESVTLPISDAPNFAGWVGSDGTLLPSGGTLVMKNDVRYTALFLDYRALEGAALHLSSDAETHLRFTSAIPNDQFLTLGNHAVFSAALSQNGAPTEVSALHTERTVTGASGTQWRLITADTPTVGIPQYTDLFEVTFQLRIRYSDETENTVFATGNCLPRSAQAVAQAALEDSSVFYSATAVGFLRSILSQSPFQPNS